MCSSDLSACWVARDSSRLHPGAPSGSAGLLVRVGTMAGERVTARKRKAGGKVVIKKRLKKFARHQSDQFMRVPVRQPPASFPWQRGAAGGLKRPHPQAATRN